MPKFSWFVVFAATFVAPEIPFASDLCATSTNSWTGSCGGLYQASILEIPFTNSTDLLSLEFSGGQFTLSAMVTLEAYRAFYSDIPPKAVSFGGPTYVSDRPFGGDVKIVEARAGDKPINFKKCPSYSTHEVYCLDAKDTDLLVSTLRAGSPLAVGWTAAGGASGRTVMTGQGFREASGMLR